jgi:ankyrin repeat protein
MENNIIELIRKGDIEGLRKAIEEGADINIQDEYGSTILMIVSYYNRVEIVKLLIEKKAKLDIQDKYGKTALDYAKEKGNQEMVELLTNLKPTKVIVPTSKVIQISTNPNINDCEFIALCEDGSIWSYSTAIRDENERWTSILNNSTN